MDLHPITISSDLRHANIPLIFPKGTLVIGETMASREIGMLMLEKGEIPSDRNSSIEVANGYLVKATLQCLFVAVGREG